MYRTNHCVSRKPLWYIVPVTGGWSLFHTHRFPNQPKVLFASLIVLPRAPDRELTGALVNGHFVGKDWVLVGDASQAPCYHKDV
jgi:hypothetical protein